MVVREAHWDDEDQLVADLGEFGLGRNEARLYLAAVGGPAMRAAELAQLADIGRTKAYGALRLLVEKGLFTEAEEPGRVARFRAVDPQTLIRRLRQQSIRDQAGLLEDTSRLVADLFQLYYASPSTKDPLDFVQLLRQGEAAWARQEAMMAGARREVIRLRRLPRRDAPLPDPQTLREGVSARAIYERGFLADSRYRHGLAERMALGEEIRFSEHVPTGFLVVDRSAIMMGLNSCGVVYGPGHWLALEHPGLGELLTQVFESQWAAAARALAPERFRQWNPDNSR
jgi:predicted DNA-binding transcriptional regulator